MQQQDIKSRRHFFDKRSKKKKKMRCKEQRREHLELNSQYMLPFRARSLMFREKLSLSNYVQNKKRLLDFCVSPPLLSRKQIASSQPRKRFRPRQRRLEGVPLLRGGGRGLASPRGGGGVENP